ncbi:MAG: hypothetical protein H6868_09535 [Rhodospirillales bacterium]|nr:hypothetical protein [Rhodospirillales bacterium]
MEKEDDQRLLPTGAETDGGVPEEAVVFHAAAVGKKEVTTADVAAHSEPAAMTVSAVLGYN